jgi:hypothetical protein
MYTLPPIRTTGKITPREPRFDHLQIVEIAVFAPLRRRGSTCAACANVRRFSWSRTGLRSETDMRTSESGGRTMCESTRTECAAGGTPAAGNREKNDLAERLCPAEGASGRNLCPRLRQFSNWVSDAPAITAFTLPVGRWGLREPVMFSRCLATHRKPKRLRFPTGFIEPLSAQLCGLYQGRHGRQQTFSKITPTPPWLAQPYRGRAPRRPLSRLANGAREPLEPCQGRPRASVELQTRGATGAGASAAPRPAHRPDVPHGQDAPACSTSRDAGDFGGFRHGLGPPPPACSGQLAPDRGLTDARPAPPRGWQPPPLAAEIKRHPGRPGANRRGVRVPAAR